MKNENYFSNLQFKFLTRVTYKCVEMSQLTKNLKVEIV